MSTDTATIRCSRKGDGDFAKGHYRRAQPFVIASAAKQSSVGTGLPRRLRLLAMTGEHR